MAGGDPLIVMSLEDENVVAVMGNRDIKEPEDLRGKTIGVVGFGDQDYVLLRRAMRNWGFDPDLDVKFEEYGHRGALWDALLAGKIGAMSATIPQPILARKIGIPVLYDFRDDNEPWQVGTFVTTRRFADENPELLRDFLAGLRQGIELFQSDFEISLPHLKARSKLEDEDVLRETHQLFGDAMRNYVPREAPIRAVARDLEAATGESVDIDFSKLVDDSYVPPPSVS
jgi:NitT/TauT family transport system substrate-binding protein